MKSREIREDECAFVFLQQHNITPQFYLIQACVLNRAALNKAWRGTRGQKLVSKSQRYVVEFVNDVVKFFILVTVAIQNLTASCWSLLYKFVPSRYLMPSLLRLCSTHMPALNKTAAWNYCLELFCCENTKAQLSSQTSRFFTAKWSQNVFVNLCEWSRPLNDDYLTR